MGVTYMSESEAAQSFTEVIAKVRAGETVLIEGDGAPVVLERVSDRPKSLPEAIRLAKGRALNVTLDDQFARDLDAVIGNHEHEGEIRDPWQE